MLKHLIKLANHLDQKGLQKEADYLDAIIKNANANKGVIQIRYASQVLTKYVAGGKRTPKNQLPIYIYIPWKRTGEGRLGWDYTIGPAQLNDENIPDMIKKADPEALSDLKKWVPLSVKIGGKSVYRGRHGKELPSLQLKYEGWDSNFNYVQPKKGEAFYLEINVYSNPGNLQLSRYIKTN